MISASQWIGRVVPSGFADGLRACTMDSGHRSNRCRRCRWIMTSLAIDLHDGLYLDRSARINHLGISNGAKAAPVSGIMRLADGRGLEMDLMPPLPQKMSSVPVGDPLRMPVFSTSTIEVRRHQCGIDEPKKKEADSSRYLGR